MPSPVGAFIVSILFERPARRAGAAKIAAKLESGGALLEARFRAAAGNPKALRTLRHIVTIERWGQRRLRVALGDVAYERDESGAYAPAADAPYERVVDDLRGARAETVALARRVADERKAAVVVEHNSMGPLTAGGWLQYLHVHAELEAKRVRASSAG